MRVACPSQSNTLCLHPLWTAALDSFSHRRRTPWVHSRCFLRGTPSLRCAPWWLLSGWSSWPAWSGYDPGNLERPSTFQGGHLAGEKTWNESHFWVYKSNLSVLSTSSLATVRSFGHRANRRPSWTPWVWLSIQSTCASVHRSLYHSKVLFSLLQLDCWKGNYSWKCGWCW